MSAVERRRGVGPSAWHVAQAARVGAWLMVIVVLGVAGGSILARAVLS